MVGLWEWAPSTVLGGRWSDQRHTEVREREREQAVQFLKLGPVQGWGKVPAAHASDTLHTACLWSEFSGCGQCGGGRSGKGAGEAVGRMDGGRESVLQCNIQRRGKG